MNYKFIVQLVIFIVTGYLLGSVSFGYIIGKDAGIDIRKSGSGNIGTTNALRTLGKKAALFTFLGDFLKAFIPVFLARFISAGVMGEGSELAYVLGLVTGLGTVLGHNFPIWMKFKGGKGIAVTSGVTVAVAYEHWQYIIIALVIFVVIVVATGYVSVGSLVVPAWALPVYALIFKRNNTYFPVILVISFLFTILAVIMHRENIKRLMNGTENKLFSKKRKNI